MTLKIFDVLGKEVGKLVDEVQELGYKSVQFDASQLTSGVYFYRLSVVPLTPLALGSTDAQAGPFTEARKLLLLR